MSSKPPPSPPYGPPPPPPPLEPQLPRGPVPPAGLVVFIVVAAVLFVSAVGALVVLNLKMKGKLNSPETAGANGPVIQIEQPARSTDPGEPDEFASDLFIPPFELVNQNEQAVTNAAFRDKITVIDFFFTHCPFICPAMNGRFGQLTTRLRDVPQLQLLSFSVDPEHDTPAHLRDHAKKIQADTSRWQFLTGKQEVVWNILTEGLKWGIEEDPEKPIKLPDGSEMGNIRHPGWFALIGPDARVLGVYKYDVDEEQDRLVQRVRELSKKMAKGK